ncbi:MAG TPA: DUF520 family protein, partial [Candidatus Saccharimonadales bacterium]|nr:DUF520 family protein [Candidatus Saccharimonadales bacterium]
AWQCDTILDIVRKKLLSRDQSSKVLDTSKEPVESNMKATLEVPFKQGLSQDNTKKITRQLKEEAPKVKTQIQGDAIRVTSSSKDELQTVITLLRGSDFDFPLQFINYR